MHECIYIYATTLIGSISIQTRFGQTLIVLLHPLEDMQKSFIVLKLSITLSMLFSIAIDGADGRYEDFTFGSCKPGKESCQECYQTLAMCLLGSDENIVNLSRAFYPPATNPAEFVAVTYRYENDSTEADAGLVGSETWFWAGSGSYFLHPLHIFTYLSLLFAKPEPYFAQETQVTLNASCMGARREHKMLLTHRVSFLHAYKSLSTLCAGVCIFNAIRTTP